MVKSGAFASMFAMTKRDCSFRAQAQPVTDDEIFFPLRTRLPERRQIRVGTFIDRHDAAIHPWCAGTSAA
jgi:hypothetical protein